MSESGSDTTREDGGEELEPAADLAGETVAPVGGRPTTKITTRLPGEFPKLGSVPSDLERASALARVRGASGKRYSIEEEIGRGGMGRILRVEDADLNRSVAMKVLTRGKDPAQRSLRFVEEAQINSQLQHPSVLSVHDFGIDGNGDLFFTMQLIPKHETVRDIIDRLKRGDAAAHEEWSIERRVQVIQQVCHALHYAHERGVVHRDVKPENIVVGEHGEVWLVDWGIARLSEEGRDTGKVMVGTTADGSGSAIAEQGGWVGTPRYMAPEQILGYTSEVDHITDVYSLSAVLYEFLTLHHYLGDRSHKVVDLIDAVPGDRPRDAESHYDALNGRVPRHLSRFCRRGLQKAREHRWQSARDLEEALQSWIEGNAPVVCPGTFLQRQLKRAIKVIDHRPVLVPAVVITLAILFAAWLAVASIIAGQALSAG